MLYVLECMFLLVLATIPGDVGTLKTTGKEASFRDLGVSILGWVVLVIIIFTITYTIKSINNRKKIERVEKGAGDLKSDADAVESNGLIYIYECMTVALICKVGRINRNMITTGKKPAKKEWIISAIGWGVLIAIIISAVLLVIYA